MSKLSLESSHRKDMTDSLMESRIRGDVYVRFGGEYTKTYHRNMARRWVLSLHKEDDPISFNPFFTEDYQYDIEKRDSIKTLILTLWKREDEPPRRSEEVALSNAVSLYIEKIKKNRKIKPNFNSFYDFVKKDYRKVLAAKNVREKDFDVDGFLNVLEPYYKNGEYGYLLNSDKELDLLNKRFIVFELDVVKDNPILFPVVTIIIMETFINKMRRLQGIRKMILIEEA